MEQGFKSSSIPLTLNDDNFDNPQPSAPKKTIPLTISMCGGNVNVKYGWYVASKSEINGILASGFDLPGNNGVYGHGVYLSAVDHPVESSSHNTLHTSKIPSNSGFQDFQVE